MKIQKQADKNTKIFFNKYIKENGISLGNLQNLVKALCINPTYSQFFCGCDGGWNDERCENKYLDNCIFNLVSIELSPKDFIKEVKRCTKKYKTYTDTQILTIAGNKDSYNASDFENIRGKQSIEKSPDIANLKLSPFGGYTKVILEKDGEIIVTAKAECSNEDNFNRRLGFKIALGRACKQLS